MDHNVTPADATRVLANQQLSLLAKKAALTEDLDSVNKQLDEIRAILRGVEIGRSLAEQAAPASEEAPSA